MITREDNRKESAFVHSSEHRDGIDCLNFFFDLINEAAGYSEKYYEEHHEKID